MSDISDPRDSDVEGPGAILNDDSIDSDVAGPGAPPNDDVDVADSSNESVYVDVHVPSANENIQHV